MNLRTLSMKYISVPNFLVDDLLLSCVRLTNKHVHKGSFTVVQVSQQANVTN